MTDCAAAGCTLRPGIRQYRLLAGTQWRCPTCRTLWVVWPDAERRIVWSKR